MIHFFPSNDVLFLKFVEELHLLDNKSIIPAWTSDQWKELSLRDDYHICLLYEAEKVGAFALCGLEDNQIHLYKIAVAHNARRKGHGHKVFNHVIESFNSKGLEIESCYLEVRESNKGALNFYESIGFELIHLAKSYYSDGGNACKMLLTF